jgi:methyltransferase (TIGR00027 family)
MSKAASKTGIGPTVLVAIEQYFPEQQRGIEDKFSLKILPFGMKLIVSLMRFGVIREWMVRASEKDLPGMWAGMICRKKFIDEKLEDAMHHTATIVNLGAGYDTRIFRLAGMKKVPVFEVDQPEIIRKKKRHLSKLFHSIPSHVKLIPVDFDHEDLSTVLISNGYSFESTTFFLMEAVTQYLTERGIEEVFNFLSNASTGSRLVFTYIRKDFLEGRVMYGWEKGYEKYVLKDRVWLFGMDPEEWPGYLKQYGWEVLQDVNYEELSGRYIEPTGRNLDSTLIERVLLARKM